VQTGIFTTNLEIVTATGDRIAAVVAGSRSGGAEGQL
jgi:hypothetical protein